MGLKLNASEITIILFTKKRKLEKMHPIKLIIILDSKLLWNKSKEAVAKKAKSWTGQNWEYKSDKLR